MVVRRILSAILPAGLAIAGAAPAAGEWAASLCLVLLMIVAAFEGSIVFRIAAVSSLCYSAIVFAIVAASDDIVADVLVQVTIGLLVLSLAPFDRSPSVLKEIRELGVEATLRFAQRKMWTLVYVLRSRGRVSVAGRSTIDRHFVYIGPGRLAVGDATYIGCNAVLHGSGDVSIGNNCYIGHRASIGGMSNLTIGDNCMVANNVSFVDNDHGHADPYTLMNQQGFLLGPIVIEEDCWIGTGAAILRGVRIGAHSIVAAGAVVRADVPPYSVVGGVPARLLKTRK